MATLKTYLKEPAATGPTPLFFMLSANGRRSKVYTGISVPPSHWLAQEQRIRTVFAAAEVKDKAERKRLAEEYDSLNQRLDMMRGNLLAYHRDQLTNRVLPTAEQLRAVVEPKEAETPIVEETPQVLADFAGFIERACLTKQAATVKSFRTTLRHLTRFWASTPEGRRKQALTYEDLTADFGHSFTQHLLKIALISDNSISKQVSLLKQFLRDATSRERHTNQAFIYWKWAKHDTPIIALTAAELRQLEAFPLPEGHYLANVRALFLLSSYTGLRFSDVKGLRPENDKGDCLRLTTQKTRHALTIPVSPKARRILDDLWAGRVHTITNQKFNVFIKDLCNRAGLDEPTEWLVWRAGVRESTIHPKYKLISSHSGRKTFASIAVAGGMPIPVIMKAGGWRSYKSMSRYIDVQEGHQQAEFEKLWGEIGSN
ncbi:site-specific integrase [Hymenobacter fastidiosus]|uniref:Site-specific integrase n=1 Tax=Hymenobacter fastidiosus TaxID=486264 RepID=A0ABP7T215_9BACT